MKTRKPSFTTRSIAIAVAVTLQSAAAHADVVTLGYQFTNEVTGGVLSPTTVAPNLVGSAFMYVNADPSQPPLNNPPFIVQGGTLPDDPPYFIGQGDWFPHAPTNDDNYYTFSVSVNPGFALNVNSFSFEANSRQMVPFITQVQYSTSPNFTNPVSFDTNPFSIPTQQVWNTFTASDAPIVQGTGTYYFRIYSEIDPNGNGTISDLLNTGNYALNGSVQPVSVTNLYWDPGMTTATGSGGSGNWLGAASWADGAADFNWSNTTAEAANFGGSSGGTVLLNGNVNATNGINFTTPGYAITGLSGQVLTVGGTISTSADAVITASITTAGAGTLTKSGSASLTLAGPATFATGTSVAITGGTLAVATNGSVIANGAVQDVAASTGNTATLIVLGTGSFSTDNAINLADQGGNGTLIVQDSAMVRAASLIVGKGITGSGGTGIVNQNGGTITAANIGLATGDPSSVGTYNLNAGTLATASITGGGGKSTFNLNGGILVATADSTNFFSGITNLQVQNGGAVIDSNSHTITLGQALVPGTDSTGGLSKNGPGTLILTTANTYTGNTAVNAGDLQLVNNPLQTTATIASAGVLEFDDSGTVLQTPTTFAGTGTIRKTGGGTFVLGDLGNVNVDLSAGATIDVEAGKLTGSANHGGILTDNLASLNIAGSATFDAVEGGTTMSMQFDALTGSGTLEGGFSGNPGGLTTITLGAAGGSGTFSGPILDDASAHLAIIKAGGGTQTFSGTNTYTGSTTVSAGALKLANIGSPSTAISIASGAALEYDDPSSRVFQNPTTYTGTGTLRKTGAGSLDFGAFGSVNVNLSAGAVVDVEAGELFGSSSFNGIWTSNKASLNIAGGATFDAVEGGSAGAMQFDALTGSGDFQGGYSGNANGLTTITLGVAGGSGAFSGPIADDASAHLAIVKTGGGTQTFSGTNTYTGGTTINAGTLAVGAASALPDAAVNITSTGEMQLAKGIGTVTIPTLSITGGGTLDLTNDRFIINYGTGGSPASFVRSEIRSGYNGGTWTGTGITSSSAAASSGKDAVGYADGNTDTGTTALAGQVLIRYTLVGDSNLDGTVNLTDLLALLNSYGQTGRDWSQGDFNYDGAVNLTDLLALLNNYGQSASVTSASIQAVPEPVSAGLLTITALSLLGRRRR